MKGWILLCIFLLLVACAPQQPSPQNVSIDRQDLLPEENASQKLINLVSNRPATFFVNWTDGNFSMSLYVSNDGIRIDTVELLGGKPVETRTFSGENSTITCSKQKDWQCFILKQQFDGSIAGLLSQDALSSVEIAPARTRSVLGLRAQCFILDDASTTEEVCYGPEGLPLYLEGNSNGNHRIWRAINLGYQLPANYLAPPALPQPIRDELISFVQ